MEVGGFPALPEEEAWRLLQEVALLFLSDACMTVFLNFSFLLPVLHPYFCTSLPMARHAQESKHLEGRSSPLRIRGSVIRNTRTGKNRNSSGRLRGRGFLWASEGSHSSPSYILSSNFSKKACHALSTTVSHLPPQESTGPEVSKPATGITEQASEAASPAALPASEEASSPLCNPFTFSWGASRECTDAGLKVTKRDHQPHMPQSSHMCTECT